MKTALSAAVPTGIMALTGAEYQTGAVESMCACARRLKGVSGGMGTTGDIGDVASRVDAVLANTTMWPLGCYISSGRRQVR